MGGLVCTTVGALIGIALPLDNHDLTYLKELRKSPAIAWFAALSAALIAFRAALLDRRQRYEDETRKHWWGVTQWAADRTFSHDSIQQEVGYETLQVSLAHVNNEAEIAVIRALTLKALPADDDEQGILLPPQRTGVK